MKQRQNSLSFRLLALVLVLAFTAAGCGTPKKKSKPVVIKFWKTFEDTDNIQPLIDAYRKKHSNVSIQYTKKNIETYEQDLLDALASGNGPDVFSIHDSWLPKYMDKITPAPEKSWSYVDYKNSFVDAVVQEFTKDQKIYGVALAVDSLALYYNKDLFGSAGVATPPKTWAELSKDVQKLSRQDKTGYFSRSGVAIGLSSYAPGGKVNRAEDIVYLMMLQKGAVPWSKDGANPRFGESIQKDGNSSKPANDALTFYTSFANPSNPNYTWNSRSDYSIDSFANGRAAMLYSYSYARQTIQQKAPNLNFDVAPVPQPNLDDPEVNFANYWGEVVSKQSEFSAQAWDFLKFISSKDALDKYYAVHKQPSSRKDLIDIQSEDPEIGVFAHSNLTAKPFYRPDQVKVDTIIGRMIDKVTLRGVGIDEAISQAVSQASTVTIPRN